MKERKARNSKELTRMNSGEAELATTGLNGRLPRIVKMVRETAGCEEKKSWCLVVVLALEWSWSTKFVVVSTRKRTSGSNPIGIHEKTFFATEVL